MTSRQSEFDPRYDQAYQRGGAESGLPPVVEDTPEVVEVSDAGPQQSRSPVFESLTGLEARQRTYRTAAWVLAGGLVVLGVLGLFADTIFPPDPQYLQPSSYGYISEPWSQRLRYTAPNLINLGILTAVVQVVLEQVQAFRLRTGR